ncbi:MAG: SsrA-binding protein SmpB [Thermodesulfobacteriota bacterium]
MKQVCKHPTVNRDYSIEERFEAGMVLTGSEVKSLRGGKASIKESYAVARAGEVFLVGSYIAPYEAADIDGYDPTRSRKLLLKKREIDKLTGKTQIKGFALVPTKVYFRGGYAKVELALGKGKKKFDKRADIKKKDAEREMARAVKRRN